MKKRIVSFLTAFAMLASCTMSASAADAYTGARYWSPAILSITGNRYLPGVRGSVNTIHSLGTHFLFDSKRNIMVTDFEPVYNNMGLLIRYDVADTARLKVAYNLTPDSALLYQSARAYDFYVELGWDKENGNHKPIYVGYDPSQINVAIASNTMNSRYAMMFFGDTAKTTPYFQEFDVFVHEYTHLVTGSKLNWGAPVSNGLEVRALSEAYSDIMGELADTPVDWKINKNGRMRNLANVANSASGLYLNDYTQYSDKENELNLLNDGMGPYYASTIISHAAYQMSRNLVTPTSKLTHTELKQIWFDSMNYYETEDSLGAWNATFSDCRAAVVSATRAYFEQQYRLGKISKSNADYKVQNVQKAFDRVGVHIKS